MRHLLGLLIAVLTLVSNSSALAGCTVSNGTGNLGSLSSFTVASTTTTTQTNSGFKCTGGVLTILGDNTIDATLGASGNTQGSTPRLYNATTGRYLPYAICKDASCTTQLSPNSSVQWYSRTLLGLLGLFTGPGSTLPLYIRPSTGIQLPSGTYTDTIPINWSWQLCTVGVLVCIYETGTATSFVTLTLEVLNDCFIDTAPNLTFDSAALISAFQPVTRNIELRCTPEVTYRVGFDMGNNPSGGWRRMLSGTNALQYNLYIPNTSTVWDTTNTVEGSGSGMVQQVSYRAVINPAQNNVPAGTYVDTVRVILTY